MKLFAPNKLIHVVEKIEKDHPLVVSEGLSISSQSLYELIQRINASDYEELLVLSLVLKKQEIYALCKYLEYDEYHADLQKVMTVIKERFDKFCFSILYRVWHNTPHQLYILNVLAEYDKINYRPNDIKIKQGLLDSWAKARLPLMAIVRTCQDVSMKTAFAEKYINVGLLSETTLYYRSYVKYLQKSSLEQFVVEGDAHISEILGHIERVDVESILLELLRCAANDKGRLMVFKELYKQAYKLWGEPNRKTFPSNKDAEYQTYKYWHDATQLSLILGHDPRRERFWAQFLGLETVHWSVERKHSMLIMTFGNKIVTEFMEMGPVYVYEKNYYDSIVIPELKRSKTPVLKSWMVNHSEYLSREVHLSHWESKLISMLRMHKLMK